jgi:hypothetical protein
VIAPHNCTADPHGNTRGAVFQDKTYGKNMRVWTEDANGNKKHCTVCGSKTGK